MSYLDWHVGMKVVCVGVDVSWRGACGDAVPQVGELYTIRGMVVCPACRDIGIRLVEIISPQRRRMVSDSNGSTELAFRAKLFRPVQRRKTDISLFTAMLTGNKERVKA